jgi:MFS transporter, PPP family, 3-phenylpropionic acid transporter
LINTDQHLCQIVTGARTVEAVAMSRATLLRPAVRLSAFYAATFLVAGIQIPFWPVWLAARGLTAREIGIVLAAAIWAKVLATLAIGAAADQLGACRGVMGVLAAVAFLGYAGLSSVSGVWLLVSLILVALTAQSALMPLGDSVTLAIARSDGLDYGRVRVWGSVSFILAALASGAILAASSADRALPLVVGASGMVLLACLGIPQLRRHAAGADRFAGMRAAAGDAKLWMLIASAAALQASHQVYYGFGTLYWRSLGFSETAIGFLWAEGVLAEILLLWHGGVLLARFGPVGLNGARRGCRDPAMEPCRGALAALDRRPSTSPRVDLWSKPSRGDVFFVALVPPAAAASVQSMFAAVSSGIGGGLVMLGAGALYAAYGGAAYLFIAVLSAAGLLGALRLRLPAPG